MQGAPPCAALPRRGYPSAGDAGHALEGTVTPGARSRRTGWQGTSYSAERVIDNAAESLPSAAAAVAVLVIAWGLAALTQRVVRFGAAYVASPTLAQSAPPAVLLHGLGRRCPGGPRRRRGRRANDGHRPRPGRPRARLRAEGHPLQPRSRAADPRAAHTFRDRRPDRRLDTEGAVERVRLRATQVRTFDGRLVLVPNGEVFTSRVTNNTASPQAPRLHLRLPRLQPGSRPRPGGDPRRRAWRPRRRGRAGRRRCDCSSSRPTTFRSRRSSGPTPGAPISFPPRPTCESRSSGRW